MGKMNSLKLIVLLLLIFLSVVLAKKEWRARLLHELRQVKETTEETIGFIRDNREEIVEQVRTTASELSSVVRDITNDVKKIGETASHLKESSEEIMKQQEEPQQR
ncbi:hypothetical protein [Halalkalibacter akibai]|uniref:Uncharacterized protein n=1 Tax=Halalkalibacter akibai (strain ATCC 43226 / DSM 21942 / CIP 109018 / JCM 9157 / 1139) TaxID=1236973 RepID=W4QWD5_HALA3|nr:hypothetical protein [Halalkalibacter akibai]GAE36425.1 hypothetical protein JCM9157_3605 [Halalkalibacter akibai JCM 9157]